MAETREVTVPDIGDFSDVPVIGKDTLLIALSKSQDGSEYFARMWFSEGGDSLDQ